MGDLSCLYGRKRDYLVNRSLVDHSFVNQIDTEN